MALFRAALSRALQAMGNACQPVLIRAALYVAAGLAVLTGFGFALASIYGALGKVWGAPTAALILAVCLAVLAGLFVLSARVQKPGQMAEAPLASDKTAASSSPNALLAPDLAQTAVFTAAFVLARRFARRE